MLCHEGYHSTIPYQPRLSPQDFDFQTEAALMYDAVHVLAHALQQVDKSTRLRLVNLSCDGDQAWAFGSSLYNYLNLVSSFSAKYLIAHRNMG